MKLTTDLKLVTFSLTFGAFVKAYHKVLIIKLKQNEGVGNLLTIWTNFLNDRKQSSSKWLTFNMGNRSNRGSQMFRFINDLSDNFVSNLKLFADYTSLFLVIYQGFVSKELTRRFE